MSEPTNGYYAVIRHWGNHEIVKASARMSSLRQAEKVERGMRINLHGDYFVDSAWFGPDIEPTEDAT